MGLESYNFILFPKGNRSVLTEYGVEIVGDKFVPISEIVQFLSSQTNVSKYLPRDKLKYSSGDCYFCYNDKDSIIEFEINCGDYEELVQEISVRYAVCQSSDTFDKVISFCSWATKKLNLLLYDMRLGEVLICNNELQLLKSRKSYMSKRKQFYELFNLPDEFITTAVYCIDVYDLLRAN